MIENGCRLGNKACRHAALSGSLPLLKYLRSIGCKWDELVPAYAGTKGHVDVMEWAVNNGCPLRISTSYHAAAHGDLDTLKWLHANGCPWDEKTPWYASSNEIYDWLANGCPVKKGKRRTLTCGSYENQLAAVEHPHEDGRYVIYGYMHIGTFNIPL
jgi:hypothetical protein